MFIQDVMYEPTFLLKLILNSLKIIFVMGLMQMKLEYTSWWTLANIDYEVSVYH